MEDTTIDYSKILGKIQAQEAINDQGVWKRQDTDFDFFTLKPYVLNDYNGTHFPESYEYASPATLNFHISLASIINQSSITFEVKSKEFSDEEASQFEGAYQTLWNSMVSWFNRTYPDKVGLRELIEQYVAMRGSVCTRVICQREPVLNEDGELEDMLVIEAFPHDPRYCVWEIGRGGLLEWFSRKGKYTKAEAIATFAIKDGWAAKIETAYGTNTEALDVREYWGKDNHIIFVADKAVITDPNTDGFVPFVVKNSKLGILLEGTTKTNKYVGESILQSLRVVIEHENRHKSVNITKNMEGFRRGLALTGDDAEATGRQLQGAKRAGNDDISGSSYPVVTLGNAKLESLYPNEESSSDRYVSDTILADKQESMFHEFERAVANSGQPWSGAALRVGSLSSIKLSTSP